MKISQIPSFLILLFLLQTVGLAFNANGGLYAQSSTVTADSLSNPEVRIPSESKLLEISELEKYRYNEPKKEMSLWDRILLWIQNYLQKLFEIKWVEYFIKGSALFIFIIVLIALVNQMLMGEIKSAVTKRKGRSLLDLSINNADVDTVNFDKQIEQALIKKNYALAVRLTYQKSLFLLKNHELIIYKQDKTNYDYLYELGDHPSANYFDRLTYFHEYIDYGQFDIDEQRFKKINTVFKKFEESLNA